jgi:DNA-binding response OmpR family regulator
LKLPLLNGFEVLEWLEPKSFRIRMEVVILSGSYEPKDTARAQEFGVIYLIKPISHEILADIIRLWIEKQKD